MSYASVSLGSIQVEIRPSATIVSGWRALLGPDGLDGWSERAADRSDATDHWSGAGSVVGAAATASRQITLKIYIQGVDADSADAGVAAVARLSRTQLVVCDPASIVRVADVRVASMQRSRISATLALVTLSLTADDPLRYSAESRPLKNGATLLPNRGDATAFGRLTLTAPHGAISIVHPGGTWTFPALASGSRLVDFRELRVWNAATGARVFGEGAGPVPRVLPGGSSWTVSGLGAGTAVLSRAEAWS